MQRLIILILIIIGTINTSFSQDLNYARQVLDTLCSQEMYGRGYVNKGEQKAAEYIANELKGFGVQPMNKDLYQKFQIPVNTFPTIVDFKINKKMLVTGKDYIIDADAPSVKGKFKTVYAKAGDFADIPRLKILLKKATGKAIIVDLGDKSEKYDKTKFDEALLGVKLLNPTKVAAIVFLMPDKLTWAPSYMVGKCPVFRVKKSATPKKIKRITLNVESRFFESFPSQNVIGKIQGQTDSMIVFTAHYDHLGTMGKDVYFPGANDNASGIAMLLNLAKYYSQNPPKYTMVFMAFGSEELGLIGSRFFVENPLFDITQIRFLFNVDIHGTGDDGIQVVNGSVYKEEFARLQAVNKEHNLLKEVRVRGAACISDHCFFHMNGVPSFYAYTMGGIAAYHDVYDRPETLPLTEFEDLLKLYVLFIDGF